MKHRHIVLLRGIAALILGMAVPSTLAVPNYWKGTSGNNWHNPANWSLTHFPLPGEDVIITNAGSAVLLTNSTPWLSSFAISNNTLTCSNWNTIIQATSVTIRSLGVITLPPAFSTNQMSNRVYVSCVNMTVDPGGIINVSGCGYRTGNGPGAGNGAWHAPGGGYGGKGGGSESYNTGGGVPYGSVGAPVAPGSGGGRDATGDGHGGGAVRIAAAGTVTINGSVLANGSNPTQYGFGAGSGGGVYITCGAFAGTTNGFIGASGGSRCLPDYAGGGGGGRIAVNYSSLGIDRAVRFSASNGVSWLSIVPGYNSELAPMMGTLWLPDTQLLAAPVLKDRLFYGVRLVITGCTSWRPENLTVSNCFFTIEQTNFLLIATNSILITKGGLGVSGTISTHGGDLVLTNGGKLYVYSAPTNGTGPNYGALVSITGNVFVGSSSWIYPYSDRNTGASVFFRMNNLAIQANGGFNAEGRGFAPNKGPGSSGNLWHGPGAGHGGRGGRSNSYDLPGQPYGLTNAPIVPGSGGSHDSGGAGGGTVRIKVSGTVTHNGLISADAGQTTKYGGGGGAGGAVFIACSRFLGTNAAAIVRANGTSAGWGYNYAGGGGGGRISIAVGMSDGDIDLLLAGVELARMGVYDSQSGFAGSLSVTNGTGYENGLPGTRRFIGPYYTLTINGRPGLYDSPAQLGYGSRADIPDGTWITNRVTTPANSLNGQRWSCIGWKLTNASGLISDAPGTQTVFQLTNNLYLTWCWTNQYWLGVSAGPGGTVNVAQVNGWYTNGLVVTNIKATAASSNEFFMWTGTGVPAGRENDNPLTATMNRERTVQANFASTNPVTKYWNGVGLWETATNWNPLGMPAAKDTAVIQSGRVILANSRYARSLSVSAGTTMVFSNWTAQLTASNVSIGGTVTLPGAFAVGQMSNRVNFVCTNLSVGVGGKIDVDGKGYTFSSGPGAGSLSGHSTGGGHGGKGAAGNTGATWGRPYGSADAPVMPGSGGGGAAGYGSQGGGVVRIAASGTVNVNGLISANGSNSLAYQYGGGAGGSVYITCATFAGATDGVIRVNGGTPAFGGWHSGGGGGGRIAVSYSSLGEPHDVRFQARKATDGYADSNPDLLGPYGAEPGTLWLSNTNFLGTAVTNGQFAECRLVIPGFTSWTADNLTISNSSFRLPDTGFTLSVAGDLCVTGGRLGVGGSNGNSTITVGRDLILTNGGCLSVYSGADAGQGYGARINVKRDAMIYGGSWLYPYSHPTNGGSMMLSARGLKIAAGGGIRANCLGYQNASGPGKGGGTWHCGGGGYGGRGGNANTGGAGSGAGVSNGLVNAPLSPGSGGGGIMGGYGGGLVHAEITRSAVIDGTIAANGGQSVAYAYGGAAGGGIFLKCRSFSGAASGALRADGGIPVLAGPHSGGGGGGRIAVWHGILNFAVGDSIMRDPDNPSVRPELTWSGSPPPGFLGTTSVAGAIGWENGKPGTVNFMRVDYRDGSVILCR